MASDRKPHAGSRIPIRFVGDDSAEEDSISEATAPDDMMEDGNAEAEAIDPSTEPKAGDADAGGPALAEPVRSHQPHFHRQSHTLVIHLGEL